MLTKAKLSACSASACFSAWCLPLSLLVGFPDCAVLCCTKSLSHVWLFVTLWTGVHGDSLGKNKIVGWYALLQGIFPTQGLNPGLWHLGGLFYHLSHQGSPWILEWVAYPFSRGTSWPRNWTRVSCIAVGFFFSWATRETLVSLTPASLLSHLALKLWHPHAFPGCLPDGPQPSENSHVRMMLG